MTNHKKNKHYKIDFTVKSNFNIPKENILDLKKLVSEKNKPEPKSENFALKIGGWMAKRKKRTPITKGKNFSLPTDRQSKEKLIKETELSFAQKTQQFSLPNLKALAGFIIIAVLLILPIYGFAYYQKIDQLKGKVLGISWDAYDHIKAAGNNIANLNFNDASYEFNLAIDNFNEAQLMLKNVSGYLKIIPVKGGELSSAEDLLKSGEAVSSAGQYLTKALVPFTYLTKENQEASDIPINLTTALLIVDTNLRPAVAELAKADYYLQKISLKIVPEQYQEQFQVIKDNLPKLNNIVKETQELSNLLLQVLGHDSQRRYLFIFQNNAELRPTGGFIGSFALMTLDQGVMKEMEVPGGGSYDLNGWLKEKVISPKPLALVNPHWYFQDANWFPDFPTSAKKLIWFFNESGGPSVDGVIALTPDVLESLLELSGPIDLTEKYGVVINKDNLREVLQTESEKQREISKEPKKIIADLTPLVFNKISAIKNIDQIKILTSFQRLLNEKYLLFYFTDPSLEAAVINREWGGEIKKASQDYLNIINTNISGGKTDLVIDQLIDYKVNIQADGKAIATTTVTRTHRGKEGDLFTGIKNIDFMRFYVPKGSKLISASGFELIDPRKFLFPNSDYHEDEDLKAIEGEAVVEESSGTRINDEFDKTVFGNWVGTEPGKSSQVSITYELPFKINLAGLFTKSASYNLLVQKQPGSKGSVFNAEISFPDNYQVIWEYPSDNSLTINTGKADFTTSLAVDQYLGLVFKK